jgi:hypothetical protein
VYENWCSRLCTSSRRIKLVTNARAPLLSLSMGAAAADCALLAPHASAVANAMNCQRPMDPPAEFFIPGGPIFALFVSRDIKR